MNQEIYKKMESFIYSISITHIDEDDSITLRNIVKAARKIVKSDLNPLTREFSQGAR